MIITIFMNFFVIVVYLILFKLFQSYHNYSISSNFLTVDNIIIVYYLTFIHFMNFFYPFFIKCMVFDFCMKYNWIKISRCFFYYWWMFVCLFFFFDCTPNIFNREYYLFFSIVSLCFGIIFFWRSYYFFHQLS